MKKLFFATFILLAYFSVSAQDVIGKWKTFDDETGEPKSIVEIYKDGNKYYGKIIKLITEENKDGICRTCESEDFKGKNLIGVVILKDLEKDDDEYNGGKITNPKDGKTYSCYIKLVKPNKLKVRGYIGFSLIGKTQYWDRVE